MCFKQRMAFNLNLIKTMRPLFFLLLFIFCIQISSQAELIPYRLGKQWGYSDTAGKIVIQPQYALADFFENGVAFVMKDSFYFGINEQGEKITELAIQYGRFVDGLCPLTNIKKQSYYINATGKNAFNIVFNAAENFSEGLAVVSMKHKCGIINIKGLWVREPDFDSSSLYFKSGFLLAKFQSKFIFINKWGRALILAENVRPAGIFSEGMAAVYVETKSIIDNTMQVKTNLQFIDTAGQIVLSKFVNDNFDYSDYVNYEKEFIDGKAIVNVANDLAFDRYFIDKNGRFSFLFSYAQHLDDSLYLGVLGYMLPSIRIYNKSFDVQGEFNVQLSSVGKFGEGLLPVQNQAGYWGYCDSNAKIIIPFIYQSANQFKNGYAIVKSSGSLGVINIHGIEFFKEL